MPVPSKVLVFVVPETCMSVYYHEHSGLYFGLGRYEGWPVEMFSPHSCICSEHLGAVLPVCDADLGLVLPGACPYPPRFWYVLSLRPV